MRARLAGLDTEYGLSVQGHGADQQIDDASEFVSAFHPDCFVGWDESDESPKADLRGFTSTRLATDPIDAQFESGTERHSLHAVRCDRILPNGARLYNDHGHPEYATPECLSLDELVLHERAGDHAVMACAVSLQQSSGRKVKVYKNNTDFHGASYGSHENYLVSRDVPFGRLYAGLVPLFVARQVITGAGKVGSESGEHCDFQISQRADFLNETASVDTLYRRPVFNTRDEPHADRAKWIRLHVICGESNMSPSALRIKVGLVKIALELIERGNAPTWELSDPVRATKEVSRGHDKEGRIELRTAATTSPRHVIESYLDAFDEGEAELMHVATEARRLLEARFSRPDEFARSIDWAAKRRLLEQFRDAEGARWNDPVMQSLDLEYHLLDKKDSLYFALAEQGAVDPEPSENEVRLRTTNVFEPSRARARALAFSKFKDQLANGNWGSLTFATKSGPRKLKLRPDRHYPDTLDDIENVEELIMAIEELSRDE